MFLIVYSSDMFRHFMLSSLQHTWCKV